MYQIPESQSPPTDQGSSDEKLEEINGQVNEKSQSLPTDQGSSDWDLIDQYLPPCTLSQSLHADQGSSDSTNNVVVGGVHRTESRNSSAPIRAPPAAAVENMHGIGLTFESQSLPTGQGDSDLSQSTPCSFTRPPRRNPSIPLRAVPTRNEIFAPAPHSKSQSLHTDQGSSDHANRPR